MSQYVSSVYSGPVSTGTFKCCWKANHYRSSNPPSSERKVG